MSRIHKSRGGGNACLLPLYKIEVPLSFMSGRAKSKRFQPPGYCEFMALRKVVLDASSGFLVGVSATKSILLPGYFPDERRKNLE